jgi:hypothetical protein
VIRRYPPNAGRLHAQGPSAASYSLISVFGADYGQAGNALKLFCWLSLVANGTTIQVGQNEFLVEYASDLWSQALDYANERDKVTRSAVSRLAILL